MNRNTRNRPRWLLVPLMLLAVVLSGCGLFTVRPAAAPQEPQPAPTAAPTPTPDPVEVRTDVLLAEMDLRQKICQLLMVAPEQLPGGHSTAMTPQMAEGLQTLPVGGVLYFAPNLADRAQTEAMIAETQAAARLPLFIAVDEEGGKVSRLGKNPGMGVKDFGPMANVGKNADGTRDPEAAAEVGRTLGAAIGALGFNLDFAPVADVFTNPKNTVIGTRAFASDPQTAAELTAACVRGFAESGTLCTLKHFPGHGDTLTDTHKGTAVVKKTWDELKDCELLPFAAGIEAGAPLVMMSHIVCEAIDPAHPACVSHTLTTELLRGEMGFEGLIVTDSLQMQAALNAEKDGGECAALQALRAGCDLLLMPADPEEAVRQIEAAVTAGSLTEARIEESVRRILRTKLRAGIIPLQ